MPVLLKTEAIRMSFKVKDASPSHQFTLTFIGSSPEEWGPKRKRFIRLLRKLGVEWWMAVEVAPETYRPHVHGFLKGEITPAQFKAAAKAAGTGRVNLDHIPGDRMNLAKHFAYPLKSLDSPDPVVRDEFLRWNAKGSKIGFESHSRRFFGDSKIKEESPSDAVDIKQCSGSTSHGENDDSGKGISTQEPLNANDGTDTAPRPDDGSQSLVRSLICHPVRPFKMIAKSGLPARSRGP